MSVLLCPHCEKPLGEEHDEKACRRKMSRRFFFGLAVAPLAAAIAAKLPAPPAKYATIKTVNYTVEIVGGWQIDLGHAVFCVTPISFANCMDEIPLRAVTKRYIE